MKAATIIINVTIMIIVGSNIYAQGWVSICPEFDSGGNYIIDGTFKNLNEGWIIGIGELPQKLYRTTDGGNIWEVQMSRDSIFYSDIAFVDNNHGWIKISKWIGPRSNYDYYLWKTRDGGNTWKQASILPNSLSNVITFIDSLTGYSGGDNSIYRTTDGGVTWGNSTIEGDVRFGIWDIYFPDRQHGWAVGDNSDYLDCGIILNTVDSGKTWQAQLPITYPLRAVCFSNSKHGCAVGLSVFGGGIVLTTNDGGDNWQEVYLTCPWLNDVVFINDSTGWIVGDYGYIGYTEDGGQTWAQVESGTEADLNRIVFVENGKFGFIFGEQNTLLRYEVASDNVAEGEINDHPVNFKLYPNYPNPFNGETKIEYELHQAEYVYLRILNLTGEEVVTLKDGWQPMGRYFMKWSGKDKFAKKVSSGVYLLHLKITNIFLTIKMCMID